MPGATLQSPILKQEQDCGKKKIPRPDVISDFLIVLTLLTFIIICDRIMRLEKCWITHNGYFCLWMTMLGVITTDMYLGLKYAIKRASYDTGRKHKDYNLSMRAFASCLACALIENPFKSSIEPQLLSIAPLKETPAQPPATEVTATSDKQTVSSLTSGNGSSHTLRKFSSWVGKEPRQRCRWCSHTTHNNQNIRCWHYCQECNAAFCFPQYQVKPNCFRLHVKQHVRWLQMEQDK